MTSMRFLYQASEYLIMSLVPREGPGPIFRWLFKLPLMYYKLGLGSLIARQVLLVITIGRKTRKPRLTALGYMYDADGDTYYVTSGWDGRTDWYRNLTSNAQVQVQVGSLRFDCTARLVTIDTCMRLHERYSRRNPFAARTWRRWTGVTFDGSEQSLRLVAAHFPMVALQHSPKSRS